VFWIAFKMLVGNRGKYVRMVLDVAFAALLIVLGDVRMLHVRVDTRVLQVIYTIDAKDQTLYGGQQMDVFIDAAASATSAPAEETEPTREWQP